MAETMLSEARQLLRHIVDEAVATRSDAYLVYDSFNLRSLAWQAVSNFGAEKDQGGRGQMKKLEQAALSALTFADVMDYVKNQVGKEKKGRNGERDGPWLRGDFGRDLHNDLDRVGTTAEAAADAIHKALPKAIRDVLEEEGRLDRSDLRRMLRLRLVQAYVRHLVAHYVYLSATRATR